MLQAEILVDRADAGIGISPANGNAMLKGTVVLLGSLPIERLLLEALTSHFDFAFKKIGNLNEVATSSLDHEVAAVLFNPSSLGLPWDEALSSVLSAFPGAPAILCHGFADHIDWPKAADAGAFHSLPVPFSIAELRQSLGFVWAARRRSNFIPPASFMAAGMVG